MARARRRSPTVLAFAVSGLIFLLWQGVAASRNGLSGVYARPAINYLQHTTAAGQRIGAAEWQAVFGSISRASELMPRNPRYLDHLGRLERMRVEFLADALDIEQVQAHARATESYYLAAVSERPTSSYFWGVVAMEKYRRGEYADGEYSKALANAARFGSSNKATQRLVAELGVNTLAFLSPSAQREVLLVIEQGLGSQPDAMFEVVGDWETVCERAISVDIVLPLLSRHCERDGDQPLP